jgi:hypothetical protein
MKSKIVVLSVLFFYLLTSPLWADGENPSAAVEELDYIILNVTLQNFDKEPEVDGLKVRIYYINRQLDKPISWEWPSTDVTYSIFIPRTGKSKKDIPILSGYERISSSRDLVYIRLNRKEQFYGNGTLLVTVKFPNGNSFSSKTYVKLSP